MCLDDSIGFVTVKKNYTCFDERLLSFKTWKLSSPTASDLSKSGFFYTNSLDTVTCFYCKLQLGQWNSTDVPQNEHLKFSPSCTFALLNQSIPHEIVVTLHIDQYNHFTVLWFTVLYIIIFYLLFM